MKNFIGIIAALAALVCVLSCEKEKGNILRGATDLSDGENKCANCYIVSKSGKYMFHYYKPLADTYTGPANEYPGSAEVLWETVGNAGALQKGCLISEVGFLNGYVYFVTPDSFCEGNACIAIKGADSGKILWSWHIWFCKGYDPVATQQVYRNGTAWMMDRNLGATSATPGDVKSLGLLYQWGRKDPFIGASAISSNIPAVVTGMFTTVPSTAENGTVEYATANPLAFIVMNETNADWLYPTASAPVDNTRWTSEKSPYDPCPYGWRVCDGGENGVWAKASGETTITTCAWDSANLGSDFGSGAAVSFSNCASTWYPATGCLGAGDGILSNVGESANYWSCTPAAEGNNACRLTFQKNGRFYTCAIDCRANAYSVRCQKIN